MEKSNTKSPLFCFNVSAKNACFADPITRVNGERFSYLVPTYDGLRGICDSVIWKPTIQWVISRVRVLNEIKTETKNMLYPSLEGTVTSSDRGYCTYLKDVSYNVEAYFRWNEARTDLENDRNMAKYIEMTKHAIKRGGRLDVFMGKREGNCYGEVRPAEFMGETGFYDSVDAFPMGPMFHGYSYPEHNNGVLAARFWTPVMRNGIITFPAPEECPKELTRNIKNACFERSYTKGVNTSGCEEVLE